MIHEYALDPASVADWQSFCHFAADFGVWKGRMICPFPNDWRKLCYEEADMHGQQAKYKVTHWLQDYAPKVTARRRSEATYALPTWFENAAYEHTRKAFHAILARHVASDSLPVIDTADLDPLNPNPLWIVNRQAFIERNPSSFAVCISPLLLCSCKVRIVDPYFVADPDQLRILSKCLTGFEQSGAPTLDWIELHVDGEKVRRPTLTYIEEQIGAVWPNGLPKAKIIRWRKGYCHDRFVLTDRGGVILGDSLHCHESRPDQITLLEDHTWQHWWSYHDPVAHAADLAT